MRFSCLLVFIRPACWPALLLQRRFSLPSHFARFSLLCPAKWATRKGIREREEFANLIAGLDNPALQTFKARKNTKGAFIPGTCFRNEILLVCLLMPSSYNSIRFAHFRKGFAWSWFVRCSFGIKPRNFDFVIKCNVHFLIKEEEESASRRIKHCLTHCAAPPAVIVFADSDRVTSEAYSLSSATLPKQFDLCGQSIVLVPNPGGTVVPGRTLKPIVLLLLVIGHEHSFVLRKRLNLTHA